MTTAERKTIIIKLIEETSDVKLLRYIARFLEVSVEEKLREKSFLTDEQWADVKKRLKTFEKGRNKDFPFAQSKKKLERKRKTWLTH